MPNSQDREADVETLVPGARFQTNTQLTWGASAPAQLRVDRRGAGVSGYPCLPHVQVSSVLRPGCPVSGAREGAAVTRRYGAADHKQLLAVTSATSLRGGTRMVHVTGRAHLGSGSWSWVMISGRSDVPRDRSHYPRHRRRLPPPAQ